MTNKEKTEQEKCLKIVNDMENKKGVDASGVGGEI